MIFLNKIYKVGITRFRLQSFHIEGKYVDSLELPTFAYYYYFQVTYNLKFGDKFLQKMKTKTKKICMPKFS